MKNLAVLFDMDGVILNTEAVSRRCWHYAGPYFDLQHDDIEKGYRATLGQSLKDALNTLHSLFGDSFPADKYIEKSNEHFEYIERTEGLPLMAGAEAALQYLREKNYRLALASSTIGEKVHRQLTAAGVIQYFETITTGDMVSNSKPDPEIYLKAAASINCAPDACVAVEDSPNGARSAIAAGMRCVLIPDQIEPPAELLSSVWKTLRSISDIPTIL
ncbi:MAG: HAD-IA family hydrolase [Treponema sp.]|nr:HAD-IA family hydrolase [Treponema sp.]